MLLPVLAERGEKIDAAHVALAARGDAIAHPVLFLLDALGEKLLVGLFLGQHLIAPAFELCEAALQTARGATVQPDGAVGEGFQEAPVMADEHEGGAEASQFRFQPFDGGKVEMVRRLVEKQDIGLGCERAGNRGAADFTA